MKKRFKESSLTSLSSLIKKKAKKKEKIYTKQTPLPSDFSRACSGLGQLGSGNRAPFQIQL